MNKLHRIVAQSCAATLLATAAAVVASAPTATAATAGGTSVTVYLTPPDPAGLAALAQAQGLSHDERIARLDQLLPDPAPVAARLASLGLTVTSEDPWSVTAQAPSSTVDALFGTRPTLTSLVGATVAQIRAATSSLPLLPSVLDGLVTAVVPDGGPAVQHAHGISYTGSQIRSAYTAPGTSPYDGSPTPTAYSSGAAPTIASIQFSTDPTLTTDLGRVGTLRPGQLQEVTVTAPNDTSGADEVALDQEALLSVAPGVNQRIYYAANTPDMGPAYQAVLNDVRGGRSDIVALTTSWGRCESSIDSSTLQADETILQSLVAAGVTVFAASGDSGIYDCDTPPNATLCPVVCPAPTVDVDYPASSPSVVGVGATNLNLAAGTETAWSCNSGAGQSLLSTLGNCYSPPAGNGGGSGGGASTAFAMPSYQTANLTPTYTASSKRLVPDIAAVGDPATGFATYVNGSNTPINVGGTSLSAPVTAGLFAATLGHYNVSSGIGDVHPWLYSILGRGGAPAIYGRDVNSDITPGTNGANADKSPNDPSVGATLGYDTVTGLGSINWDAFKFNLLASRPTVLADLKPSGGYMIPSWNVSTARGGSGLTHIKVSVISNGSTVFEEDDPVASAAGKFPGTPGASYTMLVTATDLVGHQSVSPTTRASMPITAPAGSTISGSGTTTIDDILLKGAGWTRVKTRGALGGKVAATSARGRRLSISVTGQTITLTFFAGPANGRLTVVVDGRKLVIDEYSPRAVRKSVTLLVSSSPGPHTVQLISTGSRNPRSHGRTVDVDFLTAYLP